VEHIEEALVFHDDDAVAPGMALGLDEPDAGDDLLALGEVVVPVWLTLVQYGRMWIDSIGVSLSSVSKS
jgi:hypothetical protein